MRRLLPLVIFLFSFQAAGQKIKKFSKEPEVYLQELNAFLTKDLDKNRGELLYNQFAPIFNDGTLSVEAQDAIVNTSNNLQKKRIIDIDNWEFFLKSMVHAVTAEDELIVEPWIKYLDNFTRKSKSGAIKSYLTIVHEVFINHQFISNKNVTWRADGDDFQIDFDGQLLVRVNEIDLWGFYKTDSTVIEATSGVYYPADIKFDGKGGNMYWLRAGLSEDSAKAELSNYSINIEKVQFAADSVFIQSYLFEDPIMGRLEERLTTKTKENNATFPRFYSYEANIKKVNLYPDVDFIGGFSLIGNAFYGSGVEGSPASMIFKYDDEPLITTKSKRYLLKDKLVSSKEVQVKLVIGGDSIFHPKVSIKYQPEKGSLVFSRDKEGVSQAPFINTYHDLDMYFDALTWLRGQPIVNISNLNLGAVSPVVLESQDYFRYQRFEQIQGLNDINPLFDLGQASEYYGRKVLTLEEIAEFLRMGKQPAHRFMLEMTVQGFVYYNQDKEEITIKDKVFNYLNNINEKRDYDVIRFVSGLDAGANASISLENYDMEVRGVNAIALSDSQKVALYPAGRKITVHEGLDFDFNGKITAGRFSFWGTQFFFDYDLFQLNMATIDSMRFKVESFYTDINGNRELVDVRNTLEDINGELLIDKPNNKSGKVDFSEYPIFRSGRESYVYYDRQTTHFGAYNRDEFFVELEPFEIDSLDNTSTQGLKFRGTLTSAGIFPDIQEDILVQEDYSLGFKTSTPEGGYMAYDGKGNYEGELSLSLEGFTGDGDIDYITSNAKSEEFVFYPDSTNGVAYEYVIVEQAGGADYPPVDALNVWVNWQPKNDVFYTRSGETPFNMYGDVGMKTEGVLAYGPERLGGNTKNSFLDAESISKDFWFKNREFSSDSLAIRIRANSEAPWGFELKDSHGFVNFDQEKGEFTRNDTAGYLSFPINEYIGYMDFAEWFIPEKSIEVQKLGGAAQSHMVSVNRYQDSLQFNAGSAKFFLVESLLESFDVPHIDVADARLFPDSGYVAVDPKAKMRVLDQATLLANRETKYHNFYDANLTVKSRNKYFGTGFYDYIDEDETPWPLYFEEIKVDTSGATIGFTKLKKEDDFYLSSFFAYYGKVELTADQQYMNFNGYTLIQQTCDNIETTWFKFESVIDPKKIVVVLPEDNPATRGDNLYNGIYIAPDSTSGFSAFLTRGNTMADQELISATGVLFYDLEQNSYVVTTQELLDNPDASGNYLILDNSNCVTTGYGKLSYSPKMGQVDLTSYGAVIHDLNSDKISMDIVLNFNFFFDDKTLEYMAAEILSASSGSAAKVDRDAYKVALNNMLSEKEKARINDQISLTGGMDKVPKSMQNSISFSDLTLDWSPETSSFVSDGKIGVGSILDIPINRAVDGKVEVIKKSRGDEIYIYLELDEGDYYYIQYKRNQLQFYTNDKDLMMTFREIDPKKRSLSAKDGKLPYKYNPGTKGKANLFLNKFE